MMRRFRAVRYVLFVLLFTLSDLSHVRFWHDHVRSVLSAHERPWSFFNDHTIKLRRPVVASNVKTSSDTEKWGCQYLIRIDIQNRENLLAELTHIANIIQYIPYDAILLILPDYEIARVTNLTGVLDIFVAPAAMKIHPDLYVASAIRATVKPRTITTNVLREECPTFNLNVLLVQGMSPQEINTLCLWPNNTPCHVQWSPGRKITVTTTLCVKDDVVSYLANHNAVLWIEERIGLTLRNKYASRIVQSNNASAHRLWGKGLMGEGEVVALTDTGIDYNSCFFRDDAVSLPKCQGEGALNVSGCVNSNHRKIITYRYFDYSDVGDTADGHGTHCAGILAGAAAGPGSLSVADFNGVAPGAKLAFDDISVDGATVSVPNDLNVGLFPHPYMAGARTHSISWGHDYAWYDTQAMEVDQFAFDHRDYLILVAAGNTGPGRSTVGAPANMKNGLSIGASQNSRSALLEYGALTPSLRATREPGGAVGPQCILLPAAFGAQIFVGGPTWQAQMTAADPLNGCDASALDSARIGGRVVLVQRGGCSFLVKALNMQRAGAVAVLVANNVAGNVRIQMTAVSGGSSVSIPVSMISLEDGSALLDLFQYYVLTATFPVDSTEPLAGEGYETMNRLANFSSRGPTLDNRFKPDVVCPGETIRSARSSSPGSLLSCNAADGLLELSGTSMAAPNCAGSAVLVRQYLRQGFHVSGTRNESAGLNSTSALVKAMIIHSGRPVYFWQDGKYVLPRTLPHSSQGYGRVDLMSVLWFGPESGFNLSLWNRENVSQGISRQYCVTVQSSETSLRVTIVWTDPPSLPSSIKALINNLDLIVMDPSGGFYTGNALSQWSEAQGEQPALDSINNCEQVTVNTPKKGDYVIKVAGFDIPLGPQSFALVITGHFLLQSECSQIPICPGNCNGHGTCLAGRCQCGILYAGFDCNLTNVWIKCGVPYTVAMSDGVWSNYVLALNSPYQTWEIKILGHSEQQKFYVALNQTPSMEIYDMMQVGGFQSISLNCSLACLNTVFLTEWSKWILGVTSSCCGNSSSTIMLTCSNPCPTGFFLSNKTCAACSTTSCSIGQYRDTCLIASDGQCVNCSNKPSNSYYTSTSAIGVQNACNWSCSAGFFKSGSICSTCNTSACSVGQYRSICFDSSDGVCVGCTLKPNGSSFTSEGIPYNENNCNWSCNAGYYQSDRVCRICNQTQCFVGWFRSQCQRFEDSFCLKCNNKPPAATFISAGNPFDQNNCRWVCDAGYFQSGVQCIPCNTSVCAVGQYRGTCLPLSDGVCVPCTNKPMAAIYTSAAVPYDQNLCGWSCNSGYFESSSSCILCNMSICPVGEFRGMCNQTSDAGCIPCSNKPFASIYTSHGIPISDNNCSWSCNFGFFRSELSCVHCNASLCPSGQYRGQCFARSDAPCLNCSNKPGFSVYTSAGIPFDRNNCSWKCNTGYFEHDSMCKTCTTTVCPVGQYRSECLRTADGECMPCSDKPSDAIFTSSGFPYNRNNCTWICNEGFFRSGAICNPCNTSVCDVGQYRSSCLSSSDGLCVSCTHKPSHSFYTAPGVPYFQDACAWTCNAGFFQFEWACLACNLSVGVSCPIGQYRGKCEGHLNGSCLPCTNMAPLGLYTSDGIPYNTNNCSWMCRAGYFRSDSQCSPCNNSSCDKGQYRSSCLAEADAVCVECSNKPDNAVFTTGGDPYDHDNCNWTCNSGYFKSGFECTECNTSACAIGSYRSSCLPLSGGICVPCTTKPAGSLYVSAGIPYNQNNCSWSCSSEFFQSELQCQRCSTIGCPVGQYRDNCSKYADAACYACNNKPTFSTYTTSGIFGGQGSCNWTCSAGYFNRDSNCLECNRSSCNTGQFRDKCTPFTDGICVPCSNKPYAASYTTSGIPYDTDACEWACDPGFFQEGDLCEECNGSQCSVGMYRSKCRPDSDGACIVCTNKPAEAYFRTSGNPYDANNCEWTCPVGYFRSNFLCNACKTSGCAVGQYLGKCLELADAQCLACNNKPRDAVYTTSGIPLLQDSCLWVCKVGYFQSGTNCSICNQSACAPGLYRGQCSGFVDGICLPCTNKPMEAIFTSAGIPFDQDNCAWACTSGFFRQGSSCQRCNVSSCAAGQYRDHCTNLSDSVCVPCLNKPEAAMYMRDCQWICRAGYFRTGPTCMPCNSSLCDIGQYRGACLTEDDAPCINCSVKPQNSTYTSPGIPYNTNNCLWSCIAEYVLNNSQCIPCNKSMCLIGQYRNECSTTFDGQCTACTNGPKFSTYVTAGNPYNHNNCSWSCSAGYFRFGSVCTACNVSSCPIGQYRLQCGLPFDGMCSPCTIKPVGAHYISSGFPYNQDNCLWACQSGYFQSGNNCSACSSTICPIGKYRATCQINSDSQCESCTNGPSNAYYISAGFPFNQNNCSWTCNFGYFRSALLCLKCNTSICNVGRFRAQCTQYSDSVCIGCSNKPAAASYTTAGEPFDLDNCSWSCNAGYFRKTVSCAVCNVSLCSVGQYRQPCTEQTEGNCVPCSNKPLNSFYTTAGKPYNHNNCEWICATGFFQEDSDCKICNSSQCDVGLFRGPCSSYTNSQCEACTNKPDQAYYITSGTHQNSCEWLCFAEYYKNGSLCARCGTVICSVGQYEVCPTGYGNLCENCTNKPAGSSYTSAGRLRNSSSCTWSCKTGYYQQSNQCSECGTGQCPVGRYRGQCLPFADSTCIECSNKPEYSIYTTSGIPYDHNSCGWVCDENFFLSGDVCLPCNSASCPIGQYQNSCDPYKGVLCQNCSNKPPSASFISAGAPYGNDCSWICNSGHFRSFAVCQQCSTSECPVGQYLRRCSPFLDSGCLNCTNKPPGSFYTTAGIPLHENNCSWSCYLGSFVSSGLCVSCNASVCPVGQYQRICSPLSGPVCDACNNKPAYSVYIAHSDYCQWSCTAGFYRSNDICNPCSTFECDIGQYRGQCSVSEDGLCQPCSNKPANSKYSGTSVPFDQNNCSWSCDAGYFQHGWVCLQCSNFSCPVGKFKSSCLLRQDSVCVECTGLPIGAYFTTEGIPYNSDACKWTCGADYFHSADTCKLCNTSSCTVGHYRESCSLFSDGVCKQCSTKPDEASYTSAGQPYNINNCDWSCNAGYFLSDHKCLACNKSMCPTGQYSSPCRPDSDATCVQCSNKPENSEYTQPGIPFGNSTCLWECSIGYFRVEASCVPCTMNRNCSSGQFVVPCSEYSDAECLPCLYKPDGAVFLDGCDWACTAGYFTSYQTCLPCNKSYCPLGSYRDDCPFNSSQDSACVFCGEKPGDSSYVPGVNGCNWTCNAGFYRQDLVCKSCNTTPCSTGEYRGVCTQLSDGECIACSNKPEHASYLKSPSDEAPVCAWECLQGYFKESERCQSCNRSSCAVGQYRLPCQQHVDGTCTSCMNGPPGTKYTTAGVPFDADQCGWACRQEYSWNGTHCTQAQPLAATGEENTNFTGGSMVSATNSFDFTIVLNSIKTSTSSDAAFDPILSTSTSATSATGTLKNSSVQMSKYLTTVKHAALSYLPGNTSAQISNISVVSTEAALADNETSAGSVTQIEFSGVSSRKGVDKSITNESTLFLSTATVKLDSVNGETSPPDTQAIQTSSVLALLLFTAILPISIDVFADVKDRYITAVAEAASCSIQRVLVIAVRSRAVQEVSDASRRLLQAAIEIDTGILAEHGSTGEDDALLASVTVPGHLSTFLLAHGLPSLLNLVLHEPYWKSSTEPYWKSSAEMGISASPLAPTDRDVTAGPLSATVNRFTSTLLPSAIYSTPVPASIEGSSFAMIAVAASVACVGLALLGMSMFLLRRHNQTALAESKNQASESKDEMTVSADFVFASKEDSQEAKDEEQKDRFGRLSPVLGSDLVFIPSRNFHGTSSGTVSPWSEAGVKGKSTYSPLPVSQNHPPGYRASFISIADDAIRGPSAVQSSPTSGVGTAQISPMLGSDADKGSAITWQWLSSSANDRLTPLNMSNSTPIDKGVSDVANPEQQHNRNPPSGAVFADNHQYAPQQLKQSYEANAGEERTNRGGGQHPRRLQPFLPAPRRLKPPPTENHHILATDSALNELEPSSRVLVGRAGTKQLERSRQHSSRLPPLPPAPRRRMPQAKNENELRLAAGVLQVSSAIRSQPASTLITSGVSAHLFSRLSTTEEETNEDVNIDANVGDVAGHILGLKDRTEGMTNSSVGIALRREAELGLVGGSSPDNRSYTVPATTVAVAEEEIMRAACRELLSNLGPILGVELPVLTHQQPHALSQSDGLESSEVLTADSVNESDVLLGCLCTADSLKPTDTLPALSYELELELDRKPKNRIWQEDAYKPLRTQLAPMIPEWVKAEKGYLTRERVANIANELSFADHYDNSCPPAKCTSGTANAKIDGGIERNSMEVAGLRHIDSTEATTPGKGKKKHLVIGESAVPDATLFVPFSAPDFTAVDDTVMEPAQAESQGASDWVVKALSSSGDGFHSYESMHSAAKLSSNLNTGPDSIAARQVMANTPSLPLPGKAAGYMQASQVQSLSQNQASTGKSALCLQQQSALPYTAGAHHHALAPDSSRVSFSTGRLSSIIISVTNSSPKVDSGLQLQASDETVIDERPGNVFLPEATVLVGLTAAYEGMEETSGQLKGVETRTSNEIVANLPVLQRSPAKPGGRRAAVSLERENASSLFHRKVLATVASTKEAALSTPVLTRERPKGVSPSQRASRQVAVKITVAAAVTTTTVEEGVPRTPAITRERAKGKGSLWQRNAVRPSPTASAVSSSSSSYGAVPWAAAEVESGASLFVAAQVSEMLSKSSDEENLVAL